MKETIYITGVSSGLGYGLAKVYLELGANVYGCSRREPKDLIERGLNFQPIDLSDAVSGADLLNDHIESVNTVDVAILNAAKLGTIQDMQETPLADLRETMEINVWSNKWILDVLFTNERTVRQVVAISSGASQSGSRGWNGYSLSKAALNMLTQLYAREFPATHFAAVAPGLVDTAMQEYISSLDTSDDFPSIGRLQSKRGTDEMPDPKAAGVKLATFFEELPDKLETGKFADIRDGI